MARLNSFDALRALAAAGVIVSHALQVTSGFEVIPGKPSAEPFHALTGGQMTLGGLCVAVFMILSGYLVTGSWVRHPHAGRFLAARALRLFPGLAVLVLLTILVGGLVTHASGYWSDPKTWSYLGNVLLHDPQRTLPGVFTSTPNRLDVVNGNLWTLEYEAGCYVVLLVAGLLGLVRPWLALLGCGVVLTAFVLRPTLQYSPMVWLPACFLVGSVLYLWATRIRWTAWAALGGLAVVIAGALTGYLHIAILVGGAYALVFLGRSSILSGWSRLRADPSYGMYLYGFPVQQLLVMAGVTSAVMNGLLALFIASALGFASWLLVERRALNLVRGPNNRQGLSASQGVRADA